MSNVSPPSTPLSESVGEIRFKRVHGPFEWIEQYRPGGYHPVHLRDRFKNHRYEVIRKLGEGAFSTVWLAVDHKDAVDGKCVCNFCKMCSINRSGTGRYVALKIEIAKVPKPSHEVTIFQRLSKAPDIGTPHVAKLIDQFNHEGPNGVHSCLVLELMGASVGSIIDDLPRSNPRRRGNYPTWMTKRILRDVLKGLTFLHHNDVVHGDLNRGNMLFTLKSLSQYGVDELSQDENFKWGSISDPLERIDGKIDKWAPKYLTVPQPLTAFTNISETCSIKLSDFGGGTYCRALFV
jgi:non-specific serine/threonine protein kinase